MDIFELLKDNETNLLDGKFRKDGIAVGELLSVDFVEYGSSGNVYTRSDVISGLQNETSIVRVMSGLEITLLSESVALLRYVVSQQSSHDENVMSKSLRCSIWKKTNDSWYMVFHQGTKITDM